MSSLMRIPLLTQQTFIKHLLLCLGIPPLKELKYNSTVTLDSFYRWGDYCPENMDTQELATSSTVSAHS